MCPGGESREVSEATGDRARPDQDLGCHREELGGFHPIHGQQETEARKGGSAVVTQSDFHVGNSPPGYGIQLRWSGRETRGLGRVVTARKQRTLPEKPL